MDPEKKVLTLFSLLNMESPKVQKVSHWLSKSHITAVVCHPLYTLSNQEPCFKRTLNAHMEVLDGSSMIFRIPIYRDGF